MWLPHLTKNLRHALKNFEMELVSKSDLQYCSNATDFHKLNNFFLLKVHMLATQASSVYRSLAKGLRASFYNFFSVRLAHVRAL